MGHGRIIWGRPIGRKCGSLLVSFSTSPFSRSSADPTITGHDATINTTLKGEMALSGMVMMLGAKKEGWADDGGTDDTRIRHEKNWTRTIKIMIAMAAGFEAKKTPEPTTQQPIGDALTIVGGWVGRWEETQEGTVVTAAMGNNVNNLPCES